MESSHPSTLPVPKLAHSGRTTAQALAKQIIRDHPAAWADMKSGLAAGYDLAGNGHAHLLFSGPATAALRTLSTEERARFEQETGKPFDACALHLLVNAICGQIHARAKAASAPRHF